MLVCSFERPGAPVSPPKGHGASVLRLFAPVEERLHLRHDDLMRDAGSGVGKRLLDLGAEPCVIGFRRGDRPRWRVVGVRLGGSVVSHAAGYSGK